MEKRDEQYICGQTGNGRFGVFKGASALITFADEETAKKVVVLLSNAFTDGERAKQVEVAKVLGIPLFALKY